MNRRDFGKFSLAVSTMAFGGTMMPNIQAQTISAQNNTALDQILERLSKRDIPQHVGFDSRMIALITTATLTTLGADDLLARHIRESLAAGVKPVEIREAIYQGFAYVGIAQVSRAEKVFAQVLKDAGINPELTDCTTVNDADRFEKGLAVQKGIFGPAIDQMHKNLHLHRIFHKTF